MKVLLIPLLVLANLVGCEYTLYKHPIETGARCLDGTQAAIYYSVGSGANRNKFMIYFNSGGLCTGLSLADTLEDCYQRSFTTLGSSAAYSPTRSFPGEGLLSDDPQDNPVFYDWTKVYVPYCDGSEHQGSRLQPVSYKNRDLYFRGMNNSLQQFEYLNKTFGLYSADKVVLTGVSAGGIATFQWSNYLYERLQNKQLFAMPDSGVFVVDYVSPITGRPNIIDVVSNLVKLTQTEVPFSIPECNVDFADNLALCFSAGNLVKYLKAPFFIIESQYDEWSIINTIGLSCTGSTPGTLTNCNASEIDAIEDYRRATMQALRNLTTLKTAGIWSPSCIQHGFSDDSSFNNNNYRIPSGTGISLAQAVKAFLDNPTGRHMYIDDFGWPANKGCSGLKRTKIM